MSCHADSPRTDAGNERFFVIATKHPLSSERPVLHGEDINAWVASMALRAMASKSLRTCSVQNPQVTIGEAT